jgi:pyrimidine-specific ribonucleoside hydrolase
MRIKAVFTIILSTILIFTFTTVAYAAGSVETPTSVPSAAETSVAPKPVIVDSDMAVDDWGAILYVLQNKNANVLGVFLSGDGEATCDPGVDNILRLVTISGHAPIPVACAHSTPMSGSNAFPQQWRDGVNAFNGKTDVQPAENTATNTDAVKMMKELVMSSSEPVTFLVTGPTSNVAQMLQDSPEVKDHIARFFVMGGAVETAGNVAPDNLAEWNFYIDPEADNIMLKSGVPVTLGSLDYTDNFPLSKDFVRQMSTRHDTPAAEFLYSYEEANSWRLNSGNYLWDQSTAVMMMNESFVQTKDANMCVVEEGKTQGAIQVDTECPTHQYGVTADKNEIFEEYWQVINKEK